jgi:hypothetical protein
MNTYGGVEASLHHSWPRHFMDVVSFTPRPLYLRGKSPGTHLIGGAQRRSGSCGVEKNLLALPGIEPRPVAIQTKLSRLSDCTLYNYQGMHCAS